MFRLCSSFFLVIDLTTEIAYTRAAALKASIVLMVENKNIMKLYETALICGKPETMFCHTKTFPPQKQKQVLYRLQVLLLCVGSDKKTVESKIVMVFHVLKRTAPLLYYNVCFG